MDDRSKNFLIDTILFIIMGGLLSTQRWAKYQRWEVSEADTYQFALYDTFNHFTETDRCVRIYNQM